MERVIIDMDEVMADTMGEMLSWYRKHYDSNVIEYNESGTWLQRLSDEHRKMIRQRLLSPGYFRHLPVMDNCLEVVEKINRKYELFIVSAATEFPNSLKDKLEWLEEHFPFLTWRQLVLCGDKRMIAGDYMIDDHVRNLVHFKGKAYLYTSIFNRNEDVYERVNNWKEVAQKLL